MFVMHLISKGQLDSGYRAVYEVSSNIPNFIIEKASFDFKNALISKDSSNHRILTITSVEDNVEDIANLINTEMEGAPIIRDSIVF